VDDVVTTTMSNSTLIDGTPATGLSCWVAAEHSAFTAPVSRDKGTAVPFAGLAQVAFGARVIDLPGLPPRGAPV
jgi:hypothetical protein